MKTRTITANYLKTICWQGEAIIDYTSGTRYTLDGKKIQTNYSYAFNFDTAINSENGIYSFVYQKLGTKGLLLKNGVLIREINRSYYFANAYEFPAAFLTIDERCYLIHCPIAYNRIDFEDVETGEIVTDIANREPEDHFYSRLEISPGGTYLISKGWIWHPLDDIKVFNVKDCLNDPKLLDRSSMFPDAYAEICTASFIDDQNVIIGSSDEILGDDDEVTNFLPQHIAIWNLKTNKISKPVPVKEKFGNLFAINERCAWDLFAFPKIIDILTGEIVEQNTEINSGLQKSSITSHSDNYPSIIFNRETKQIAMRCTEEFKVFTPELVYDL